jgi:hypothetical protein
MKLPRDILGQTLAKALLKLANTSERPVETGATAEQIS